MSHRINRPYFLGFWAIMICGYAPAGAVETVKLDNTSGVPRIMVDGQPVRARIFFGGHASSPITISESGRLVTFEFSPIEDEPSKATMHIRFGEPSGNVYLDDIRCVDLRSSGRVFPTVDFERGIQDFLKSWHVYPPESQDKQSLAIEARKGRNRSAALRVTPPDDPKIDFHIYHDSNLSLKKGHRYRVSFWAQSDKARDLTIDFYRPGESYLRLGGPPGPFISEIKLAASSDVDLVSFWLDFPWPKPNTQVDWSATDAACQQILDANPNALLIPRIYLCPPKWWFEQHPDDLMTFDHGTPTRYNVVVTSAAFRRETAERLSALIEHIEEKFGPHVAGYHISGQNTAEWFYQDTWGEGLNGYADGDCTAWRAWLKARYGNDLALREAWHNKDVTLDSAAVPSPESRRASPAGLLRDPAVERPVIDFTTFQQEAMADCICYFAHVARQASLGRKLVFSFYGYLFEFGQVGNGPATSGHYALRRVLDCPDIDVLCSPISYTDRGLGQSAPAMTAAESVALAGKMWLFEDDTSTYLSSGDFPGWREKVDTVEETNSILLRNTGQCAVRNFGTWWMDLGRTGWFDDPRMWAEMARLEAIDEPLLNNPTPFRPEVAVVIDEPTMHYVTPAGTAVTGPGISTVRQALGRMGAPYGQYLLDDVLAGRVKAKMYVFLNAWRLTAQDRKQLLEVTRNALCYAPGIWDDDSISLEASSQLTGFKMEDVSKIAPTCAKPTEQGKKCGLQQDIVVTANIQPRLVAADASKTEALAVYSDNSAAVALRQTNHGASMFVGTPGLNPELLRLAASRAGVHLFTQADCNVYANGPFIVLHGSQDGTIELDTGSQDEIYDLFSGEMVGQGPKVSLPLKKGETRILYTKINEE